MVLLIDDERSVLLVDDETGLDEERIVRFVDDEAECNEERFLWFINEINVKSRTLSLSLSLARSFGEYSWE